MRTFQEKLDRHSIPEPNSGCWLWFGCQSRTGYGIVSVPGRPGKNQKAHRASWEYHNGPIADGLCVLHRCDVRCCVNPDHLFLGTMSDNTSDMYAKGRANRSWPKGDKHPCSKLTEDQAREILRSEGTLAAIAEKFNVSMATIGLIRSGKRWGHLKEQWQ